jgi:SAM-dependent methyltransferase
MLYLPKTIRRPLGRGRRAIAATRRNLTALVTTAIRTPFQIRSARAGLLACSGLRPVEKELIRKVSGRISMSDDMYIPGEAEHYLAAGLSALRCITRVLDHLKIDRASIRSVLDLPSGGGRVLRFLQIAFPHAALVACDTNLARVEFCRKAFGARTVPSVSDFKQLHLPGTFGLIWCGSLLTHIDETRCTELLRLFYNHLPPEGVCIFSTHGATAIDWLRRGEFTYGLSGLAQQSLLSQVTHSGFGYVNYDGQNEYGISLVERDRMTTLAERVGKWSLAAILESGWDNFHDVYAFTKRSIGLPLRDDKNQLRLNPHTKWWETERPQ